MRNSMCDSMDYDKYNVYVGAQTGIFKGVRLDENVVTENNLNGLRMQPEEEITAMAWSDSEEREIIIGLANQTVKIYNTQSEEFTSTVNAHCGDGPIRGVKRFCGSLVTAAQSGEVKIWSEQNSKEKPGYLKTGNRIERMRSNNFNNEVIAVGGNEADLSLWDLENNGTCIFRAKNVPHNELDLRVPIWVSDMAFLSGGLTIAACSRYGHLRLYDPKAQRRPVLNMFIPDQALTSISSCCKEQHVIVGSGTGLMMLVDLRGKGLQLNHYKGLTGSIREIVSHPTDPYILSVGLDRFLRLHHLETKALLRKVYLKSKLNCLLMRSDFCLRKNCTPSISNASENSVDVSLSEQEKPSATQEMDQIFSEMDCVGTNELSYGKRSNNTQTAENTTEKKLNAKALTQRKRRKGNDQKALHSSLRCH